MASGASSLQSGANSLSTGSGTLADGTETLLEGATALRDGIQQFHDGATELRDGAQELHDGMEEFQKEGISRLTNLYRDSIPLLHDRLAALQALGRGYNSYSDLPAGADGSVKFLIQTKGLTDES